MKKLKYCLVLSIAICIFPIFVGHVHAENCPACGSANCMTNLDLLPGCTTSGEMSYTCMDCGYSTVVAVSPLGHDYAASAAAGPTPATCTSNGVQPMSCTRCGDSYNVTIPALGHNYLTSVTSEATCTTNGSSYSKCSRCGDDYTSTIPALGHNYVTTVTKKATCTETGQQVTKCSRCQDSSTKTLTALGHDYETKIEKEATCTQDGLETKTCKRCKDKIETVIPALGHTIISEETVEPTCEEDGVKTGICDTCKEEVKEIIPAPGHMYPDEWTAEKEPTYFKEGLESKTCETCEKKIDQPVAKKPIDAPLIGGVAAAVAAIGGIGWFFLSKKAASSAAKIAFVKPKLSIKKVMVCLSDNEKNREYIELLKSKLYLKVKESDRDTVSEDIKGENIDMIITDIACEDDKNSFLEMKEKVEEYKKDMPYGIISDMEIDGYETLSPSYKNGILLVRMILPLYKPDLRDDNSVEYLGEVAEALGFPAVKLITGLYLAGKDISDNLDKNDKGVSEAAGIVEDIAFILGFDKVEKIAGLIDSSTKIKDIFDENKGNRDKLDGAKASKEIIDSLKDVL